jgi:nicotinamide-nucleotide amidase
MQVDIVTIGDELLLGLTIDTNGAWLGRELAAIGVTIARRTAVSDRAADIAGAVRDALERTGAVITTGGLGPTADDLTKPAIADLFGRDLEFHEAEWERLRARWVARRHREPPEANRQQVMLPRGSRVLVNHHGTAPGVFLEDERGRWVAMVPGVPREMREMVTHELLPLIRERLGEAAKPVRMRTVRTTGVAESDLPARLGDAASGIGSLELSYLPGPEGIDLRLTSRTLDADAAERALGEGAALLAERVGAGVYATELRDMAAIVLDQCRAAGATLAVAESCTGGLLGARLTAIPGSSDVFLGGVIAYHNDVKRDVLGVSREMLQSVGAVSDDVARAMASAVRSRLGATIGIAITGVAGPGGGTAEKPVGMVYIAVDLDGDVKSIETRFVGDRDEIRFRATQAALDMVRRR